MNRRILPFSLVVCGSILAYACSSSDSGSSSGTTPQPDGSTVLQDGAIVDNDGNVVTDTGTGDTSPPPNGNPIDGIAAPTALSSLNAQFANLFTDGPIWHTDSLYFSTVGSQSYLVKLTPPSQADQIHSADPLTTLLGSTFDVKTSSFLSCEAAIAADGSASATGGGSIIKTPPGGAGTALTLNYDAGSGIFDSPDDLVSRKDGVVFVTDPGLQSLATLNNHIWRLKPNLTPGTYDVFETRLDGRPKGIALSADEKTLFVAFVQPATGNPVINKFTVATADGALGPAVKFVEIPGADIYSGGLAIDTSGNIYAAVPTGVDVFKNDGTKWGHITTAKNANNVAFGGADAKTLYITSGADMYQVTVKIAGLLQ